jgi:hypothetical protein
VVRGSFGTEQTCSSRPEDLDLTRQENRQFRLRGCRELLSSLITYFSSPIQANS